MDAYLQIEKAIGKLASSPLLSRENVGKLHKFSENFVILYIVFEISSNFLKKLFQKVPEIRNLNFVTSELDSESLSTLRKIIFKRDSCKVDEVVAPVITSCAKCLSVSSKKFQKTTKCFKKIKKNQKNSKKFKKIQKIANVFRKSIYL
jgi:hypothetical protein